MKVLLVVCVFALVSSCFGLGTMWVNRIVGNDDALKVTVEEVIFDDNKTILDFMYGLETPGGKTEGVYVEDTNHIRGNWNIPVDLLVEQVGTNQGEFRPNGGVRCDDGDGGVSFSIDNDTGITYVKGETRPNGGINVSTGAFVVEDDTGRTTIRDELLRPNGRTTVNNGLFLVEADDGKFLTRATMTVEKDIILGTNLNEGRGIRRVDNVRSEAGRTIIKGQDGVDRGGNLVLTPGFPLGEHDSIGTGDIQLGRAPAPNVVEPFVTRREVVAANGGITTIRGQPSKRHGGRLIFQAGSTGRDDTKGANVVLNVGKIQDTNAGFGEILLGNPNEPATDLHIRRTTLSRAQDAAATRWLGQSSTGGKGGNLYLQAGAPGGSDAPGNLYLQPGKGPEDISGKIIVGVDEDIPATLLISRQPTENTRSGNTYIKGQSSHVGNGGDLYFNAGDASTRVAANVESGGDILLTLATRVGTTEPLATLNWGVENQVLEIHRPLSTNGVTTATTIRGQQSTSSTAGVGGDVSIIAGAGATAPGDLILVSPNQDGNGNAGSVSIAAAAGFTTAGSLAMSSGDGVDNGGDFLISAGGGNVGGDLKFTAGSAVNVGVAGYVIIRNPVNAATSEFRLRSVDFEHYSTSLSSHYIYISTSDDPVNTPGTNDLITRIPTAAINGIFSIDGEDVLQLGSDNNRFIDIVQSLTFSLREAGLELLTPDVSMTGFNSPVEPEGVLCELYTQTNNLICALHSARLIHAEGCVPMRLSPC